MSQMIVAIVLLGLGLLAGDRAMAVTPDAFNPAEYTAPSVCPGPLYEFDKTGKNCVPQLDAIRVLDEAKCKKNPGFVFTPAVEGKPANCAVGSATAPEPSCKVLPSYSSKITADMCSYSKIAATSAPGNFVGDCLKVDGIPPGLDVQSGNHYVVTAQAKVGDDGDKILTVVSARKRELLGIDDFTFTCSSLGGPTREFSANALLDAGARRYGWAFGALTLPYKYFGKEGAFVTGVPVGLYSGYRWGQIGSGITLAFGATVGSVKADTVERDASGAITKTTGTADVAAIGITAGLIWDISKAKETRPFKIGLFYGSDRVSKDQTTIDYKYNKRPWIAFQIGYDFTDN